VPAHQVVAGFVPVSSTRAAEMAKLLEKFFRCVNIRSVNELKQLSLRMNIDIWEVMTQPPRSLSAYMPFIRGQDGRACIPWTRTTFLESARI